MSKHKPIKDHTSRIGNHQRIYKFPNGYGASVIQGAFTYGGPDGLWELAVLDRDGNLCYDTPITGDVLGHLTADDVEEALDRIAALEVAP